MTTIPTKEQIEAEIARIESGRQELIDFAKDIDPTGQYAGAYTDNFDQTLIQLRAFLAENYPTE